MNCNDCQKLFSLYLDNEIDQHNKSLMEAHFHSCPDCKMEWQAFRNTVAFLRDMPMPDVPSGFLTGIHDKLSKETPWTRFKGWLAGTGQHKVAIPTAFAMLAVGFATAYLVQNFPVSQPGTEAPLQQAGIEKTAQKIVVAQNKTQKTESDDAYYPGVPLLSEYEDSQELTPIHQFAMVPRKTREQLVPQVDFVSTHTGIASSSYLHAPLTSFSGFRKAPVAINPDLLITLHSAGNGEHLETIRQIMQSPLWQAEVYNENTLLLSVPASNFNKLHKICCQKETSFSPSYAGSNHYFTPKRMLTVAVRLD
ncbi:MAG: zf-HC2 domain-containing protein [Desulfobulbaceae bacterium]|nr:zf-HC2 domain-containing protein [Desulfobulbaceae bacterium]